MIKKPLVSVLVPVYNVEKYLDKCLDSILSQTLTQIEVICVNDGSTDGSLEILEKYQKMDSRISIVTKENGGLPSARNAGLDRAKGKYVGFVDSDDYVEANMFEILYNTAEKEHSDVVICGANIFPEEPHADGWLYDCLSPSYKKIEKFDPNMLFFDVSVTPFLWRTIIRKELIDKNQLRLQEDVVLGEDKAFQCKVYPLAKSITVIPDKLYNYYWYREGSLMSQTVYDNPEKKVYGHVRLIEHISETVKKNDDKSGIEKSFLEWSIPFIYDDFIALSWGNSKKLNAAKTLIDAWNANGYRAYKYELPTWKREMVDYFEQVTKESAMEPRLSVVVPVDINAEYIENMLEKLLSQSLREIEIILINNGTKDEYYGILHKTIFKDKRVRLLNMAHTTYAEALNKGIGLSSAKYITFMETYDWYEDKDALLSWVKYAEEMESDVCSSPYCMKNMPDALAGEYRNILAINEEIGRYLENDFQNILYRTDYLKEKEITFQNSTIVTGLEFLATACLKAKKLSRYEKVVYAHRNIHKPDWISTEKCKTVLAVFEKLMELSIETNCAYLQVKIIEMLNGDSLGKVIVNNTRAFRSHSWDFPNGENSQIEIVESLLKIAGLVNSEFLEKNGYRNDRVFIKTLYEVIRDRQKFLAELSNT